ncbi:hypothetical protein AAGW05_00940 [Arthrobacter sp. LAPM80]|uniref:hypothetical protein n=1 Tax=Arthrobacter sp. LAPM80 TaxID=3141788 RepID=UPI00398BA7CC
MQQRLVNLQEAAFALQHFSDNVRVDLRIHPSRNGLDDLALATIQAVLDPAAAPAPRRAQCPATSVGTRSVRCT